MRRVLWVMEKPTYEQMLHFIRLRHKAVCDSYTRSIVYKQHSYKQHIQ